MTQNKILLFIPCYNCEKQIVRVLSQLDETVMSFITQVLIVNNRSSDNTEFAVQHYLEEHRDLPALLVRNDENYGLGGSHKVAFNYAIENNFDYVIVLHGDDQGSVKDLLPYLEDGTYSRYDSFLGSRFERKSVLVNYSKFRIFGNHVFNTIISIAAGKRLTDLGSGLNMYSRRYLENKFYIGFPNTLTFNVYMLLYGVHSKSAFDFFPLTWREEDQISNAKFVKQSKEILWLIARYLFDRRRLFAKDAAAKNYTFQIIYKAEEL